MSQSQLRPLFEIIQECHIRNKDIFGSLKITYRARRKDLIDLIDRDSTEYDSIKEAALTCGDVWDLSIEQMDAAKAYLGLLVDLMRLDAEALWLLNGEMPSKLESKFDAWDGYLQELCGYCKASFEDLEDEIEWWIGQGKPSEEEAAWHRAFNEIVVVAERRRDATVQKLGASLVRKVERQRDGSNNGKASDGRSE